MKISKRQFESMMSACYGREDAERVFRRFTELVHQFDRCDEEQEPMERLALEQEVMRILAGGRVDAA